MYGFIAADSFFFLYSFPLFFHSFFGHIFIITIIIRINYRTLEQDEIDELKMRLHEMGRHQELSVNELQSLQSEYNDLLSEKVCLI